MISIVEREDKEPMKLDKIIAVRSNKTVYRDGQYAVKVFAEGYPKADILGEAANHSRAEETGLLVPPIRDIHVIDGKWAIVTDFIQGKSLAVLMEEDPDKTEEYLELLAAIQLEISSKTCRRLSKVTDRLSRKICGSELNATVRFGMHTRLEAMPRHTKLCHGDLRPENIIITDEGKAYILDWSHAAQGNASADVANTCIRFVLDGKHELATRYLEIYCEKSGTTEEYVRSWIPMVAAALSVDALENDKKALFEMASR